MNISRTWKVILAAASAIILIATAAKALREIWMWDFWKHLSPWYFFSALAALTLIALGISWLKDRLAARFLIVRQAFTEVRKEMREGFANEAQSRAELHGTLSKMIKELDSRVAALEEARTGKE